MKLESEAGNCNLRPRRPSSAQNRALRAESCWASKVQTSRPVNVRSACISGRLFRWAGRENNRLVPIRQDLETSIGAISSAAVPPASHRPAPASSMYPREPATAAHVLKTTSNVREASDSASAPASRSSVSSSTRLFAIFAPSSQDPRFETDAYHG